MTYLCDLDPVEECEPLPCDEANDRAMAMGSLALLRAIQVSRGQYVPPAKSLAPRKRVSAVKQITTIPGEARGKRIIRMTADAYGYTVEEMTGSSRKKRLVCARAVAARLLRNAKWKSRSPRFSLPQIAKMLGRDDHSSVCHYLDVFGPYRRKYPEMKALYNLLRRRLR